MRSGAPPAFARWRCNSPATRSTTAGRAARGSPTTRCSSSSTLTSVRWHSPCRTTRWRSVGRSYSTPCMPRSRPGTASTTAAPCTASPNGRWSVCAGCRACAASPRDERWRSMTDDETADLVPSSYVDAYGGRRTIASEVRSAVLATMGLESDVEPGDAGRVVIARPGTRLPEPGEIVLEDRTRLGRVESLPRDAPFGYHRLGPDDGREALVLAGPGRWHVPPALRGS